MNFSALIGIYKVSHCLDLWVVLVRLCLLGVEWVNFRSSEHVREDKILEDLDALRRAGFVIVAEGLKKVFRCTIPLSCIIALDMSKDRGWTRVTFAHPHLASALLDNTHDPRMWNCGAHTVGCIVYFLRSTTWLVGLNDWVGCEVVPWASWHYASHCAFESRVHRSRGVVFPVATGLRHP